MQNLIRIQPKVARRVKEGIEEEIAIDSLVIDETVIVKRGEAIPVDGRVTSGASFVDEAMMTGESAPIAKKEGDKVIGGTINLENPLYVVCEKKGKDSILGRMISLVENAQNSKLPIQKLVDKVSGVFVPIVIGISIFVFILWLVLEGDFQKALKSLIAVLIISCPCALGLATPVVIMVSVGRAAKKGILIKDFQALEIVGKVDQMVLDKTGTVTMGEMRLIKQPDDLNVVKLATSLARFSSHPLAQAIQDGNLPVKDVMETPGMGIQGEVDGNLVYLGSKEYFEKNDIAVEENTEAFTAVYIALKNQFAGVFLFEDPLKLDARESVQRLKTMGITTHLVSGDRSQVVKKISDEIVIDHFRSEASPETKGEYIKKLSGITCMVGDGVNDAIALASASLGIAMGSGTDVAMEAASIGIMGKKLSLLPDVVILGKKTKSRIIQNIIYAFGYNIIAIPIAAFGLLNPIVAGLAMALSSLSVVINALRKY